MEDDAQNKVIFESNNDDLVMKSELKRPLFAGWLIAYSRGLIKDESVANKVLVAIIVFSLAIALLLPFFKNDGKNVVIPPGVKMVYPPDGPPRLSEPVL